MSEKSLFLIDATAFCYRAFYALGSLSTSTGQQTNAIYGFINILNKILKDHKPDYLVCCFDLSRVTFRQKKFADYKTHRPPMPDGLVSQIPIIKEVVSAYGVPIFEKEGFEADDIIAHLAKESASKALKVTVVSNDKDILQLVGDNTLVFSPLKDSGILYDAARVKERFGVEPKQVADLIALLGDTVDNIPGVPGVGEKTAQKLVQEFGSLEKLLKNIDKVQPPKIRDSLAQNIERVKLNKELIRLDQDVKVEIDLKKAKCGQPDYARLATLFKRLEFKKLLAQLPQTEEEKPEPAVLSSCSRARMAELLDAKEEVTVYGRSLEDMYFCAGGKFFGAECQNEQLRSLLADPLVKKTGHDLKKLKVNLFKEGLVLDGLDFDLMIAAYVLNPSRSSYALEDLALENLSEFIRPGSLGTKEALALCVRLKPVLMGALKEKGLDKLFFELEMPLVGVLAAMEQEGINLDLKLLKELGRDIEQRLIKLISDIYEASGTQFNINSPKQLGEILFVKLGLPAVKKTKTGFSTDEEVLNRLADKHPLPKFLLTYRQLSKIKNTYVDALLDLADARGKVYTCFNQTGTETGRLSSCSPNLQNIPVKTDIGSNIRKAIIASGAGHCLLACDYSQIELRVLAHLSGDDTLIQAFKRDQDVHRLTASLIYDVPESKVKQEMREVAKRVNFGIIYGQSAFGLSKDLEIPVKQAQDFIDAYFLRYPKVREFIDAQIKKAQEQGFVTTLLGRRRYIPEINNKNMGIRQFAQRQAVNTPIQGSASDLIKLAMIKIYSSIKTKGLGARMILQIHDELVFDLPETELKVLSGLVKKEMENVMKLDVPVRVDMKKGANWLEMREISQEGAQ